MNDYWSYSIEHIQMGMSITYLIITAVFVLSVAAAHWRDNGRTLMRRRGYGFHRVIFAVAFVVFVICLIMILKLAESYNDSRWGYMIYPAILSLSPLVYLTHQCAMARARDGFGNGHYAFLSWVWPLSIVFLILPGRDRTKATLHPKRYPILASCVTIGCSFGALFFAIKSTADMLNDVKEVNETHRAKIFGPRYDPISVDYDHADFHLILKGGFNVSEIHYVLVTPKDDKFNWSRAKQAVQRHYCELHGVRIRLRHGFILYYYTNESSKSQGREGVSWDEICRQFG